MDHFMCTYDLPGVCTSQVPRYWTIELSCLWFLSAPGIKHDVHLNLCRKRVTFRWLFFNVKTAAGYDEDQVVLKRFSCPSLFCAYLLVLHHAQKDLNLQSLQKSKRIFFHLPACLQIGGLSGFSYEWFSLQQLPPEVCWTSEWRANHWSLGTLDSCCYPPLSRDLGIWESRAGRFCHGCFFGILLEVGRTCCDYLRFHGLFHTTIIVLFSYFVPGEYFGYFFFFESWGFTTCSVVWKSGCPQK